MKDVQALYQAKILEHDQNPRNEGQLANPSHHAKLTNTLCGDRVSVDLLIEDDVVKEVGFVGRGCALMRASASIMTEVVVELETQVAFERATVLEKWLSDAEPCPSCLAMMQVFEGVRSFPSRIECVALPWVSLKKALHQRIPKAGEP